MTKRTLGSVVKAARNEARMSQRELAAAIGVKASHIAYIEAGRRRPSIPLIIPLSKTLGLDAKELLLLGYTVSGREAKLKKLHGGHGAEAG